jgi:putative transcriptional regulator
MSWMPSVRLPLAFVALLAPAALLAATTSDAPKEPKHKSLAGQLLVASPAMRDPRFAQTVILMVRHDATGALGIVINRPLRERPVGDLLEALGEPRGDATGNIRIFHGGPVQTALGFVVHSGDYKRPETFAIAGGLGMTGNSEIVREIVAGRGPRKSLIAFGYAGWAPGQLEGEIAANAWYLAPADPKFVFDEDRDKLWELAVARRTQEL